MSDTSNETNNQPTVVVGVLANPYSADTYYSTDNNSGPGQPVVVTAVPVIAAAVPVYSNGNPIASSPAFSTTLCQCCTDNQSCCVAGFAPCFVFASIKVREDLPGPPAKDFWVCAVLFGLLFIVYSYLDYFWTIGLIDALDPMTKRIIDFLQLGCMVFLGYFTMKLRIEYKKKHGIIEHGGCCCCTGPNDSCSECCISFFCLALVLAQMARHSWPTKPKKSFYCDPNAALPDTAPGTPIDPAQQTGQQADGVMVQGKVLV
jgi:Cys-rich protein (TIGR01571 family)